MPLINRISKILLFLFFSQNLFAQVKPIGTWQIYLSYAHAKQVVQFGNRIYCSSDQAIFYFDKSDNSVTPMSRLSGLNDVGINFIDFSNEQNVLVVVYENSNIDLIYADRIVNISDIKRKNTTGDKTVYGVTFNSKYAYLATGFGVVAIDLAKSEIKDTYVIGQGGAEAIVFAIANDGSNLYASTDAGILRGSLNSSNLNDFAQWTNVFADNNSSITFNKLAYLNGKLIVNTTYSNSGSQHDSIVLFDIGSLQQAGILFNGGEVTRSLRVAQNKLYVTNYYSVLEWNNTFSLLRSVFSSDAYSQIDPNDAISDESNDIWIADGNHGLVKWKDSTQVNYIVPSGPAYGQTSSLWHSGEELWVTHGPYRWADAPYLSSGFSSYKNGTWRVYNEKTIPHTPVDFTKVINFESLITDPSDPKHVWVGSRINGLVELQNDEPVKFYDSLNSTLEQAVGNWGQVKVGGLAYDKEGNLWVVNSGAVNEVHRVKPDHTWDKFTFGSTTLGGNPFFGEVVADSYGYVWVNFLGGGVVVLDPATGKSVKVTNEPGHGNLPTLEVRTFVEDKEGQIWFGTSKGVAVIYSPGSVFSGGNYDAQQILISENGTYHYLLDFEIVTAIAVDGANRKWFGTAFGGIFLTSADGTQQLAHFNTDNSPMISNLITSLTINPKTGELFIGTDRGLESYQTDAIEGSETCDNVTVYPNPVRENYSGPIAIKGVISNSNIKITDVAGNLVYETTALGGQAVWYGKNFDGKKVQTGVYLVYSSTSSDSGTQTCVTKVLLIN